MKEYPTIPREIMNIPIYAFDKLDGSNIRAEWNKNKKQFFKFGTRHQMIDEKTEVFGESIKLIKDKYEFELNKFFKNEKIEKAVCFFEFFGKNSFAGNHLQEVHDVVLFDISMHKKGIMNPVNFYKNFNYLGIPNLLYSGTPNQTLIDSVKNGTLTGLTFEGVVCKEKHDNPKMFKIKNKAWLDKLKNVCSNEEEYEQRS